MRSEKETFRPTKDCFYAHPVLLRMERIIRLFDMVLVNRKLSETFDL